MLRTLFAAPALAAETLAFAPVVMVAGPRMPSVHEPLIKLWSRSVVRLCGVRLSVEGTENLDPGQRYIFMANHQSYLDPPCLTTALPMPVRFVAKGSLFRVPLFGHALRAIGTVPVDRQNRQDALRKLREAEKNVTRHYSMLFFAEGTRSPDGALLPFKRGGVAMSRSTQLPIVPLAIAGTRHLLPKNSINVHAGPVRVAIGKPIPPGPDTPEERDRLLALVRSEVAALLEPMERELA